MAMCTGGRREYSYLSLSPAMKKMAWFEYRVTIEFPTVIDEEEVLRIRDECG